MRRRRSRTAATIYGGLTGSLSFGRNASRYWSMKSAIIVMAKLRNCHWFDRRRRRTRRFLHVRQEHQECKCHTPPPTRKSQRTLELHDQGAKREGCGGVAGGSDDLSPHP